MGRPRVTPSMKSENWKDQLIKLGSIGASEVEMRAALNKMSDGLWYALKERDEQFLRTVEYANELSQAWWEKLIRESIYDSKLNFKLVQLVMRNRFKWDSKERAVPSVPYVINIKKYSADSDD